jgi:hypothetical protein
MLTANGKYTQHCNTSTQGASVSRFSFTLNEQHKYRMKHSFHQTKKPPPHTAEAAFSIKISD